MAESRSAGTLLSIADIATEYGLAKSTVGIYNRQAAQRRRAGTVRPHDFPEPADRVGNIPLFDAEEVHDWFVHRPGQGAGGGRPRKNRTEELTSPATDSEDSTCS